MLAALAVALPVAADLPAGKGPAFPHLLLKDQHGKPCQLPSDARWVLFVRSRAEDQWSDPVLKKLGAPGMAARHLVYLSDVSGMPALIARLFALPALRRRHYPVVLMHQAHQARGIPVQKGCASLTGLDSGRIVSSRMLCGPEVVRQALDELPVRVVR